MSSTPKKIAVLVGSLRKESLNRKIAENLKTLAPKSLQLSIVDIGQLPLYNQDLDDAGKPPSQWVDFRNTVKSFDGLCFVTPEYNRSIPGAMKNAVDVGSRPIGSNIFDKKPTAVISASPGAIGGFGANQHLRQSLSCLNVIFLPVPEAYIGGVSKLLGADGKLENKQTQDFLRTFLNTYADWIAKVQA